MLIITELGLEIKGRKILEDISLTIPAKQVTAIIGPSGCGKSSLLRSLNRLVDLTPKAVLSGSIRFAGVEVLSKKMDVSSLRCNIGMVFQKPNPFPKSIYDNVAYGLRLQRSYKKRELDTLVETSLKRAALWDEVKDRLEQSAYTLSGGQQQRLVIARAIAVEPSVLLLDEPASSLDPSATLKIEELIYELKSHYTVVIATHNLQQAARVSDMTAFLVGGRLIEYGETDQLFTKPLQSLTENYLTGRFQL